MASVRTPEARAKVLQVLRLGHFREVAAQVAGISAATLCRWIQDDPGLREEVERIEAETEVRFLQIVSKGAIEDPRLACWWLERRRPERWGRRTARAAEESGSSSGAREVDGGGGNVPMGFEEDS